jgi:hypothetical protein
MFTMFQICGLDEERRDEDGGTLGTIMCDDWIENNRIICN